jgi:hypothetical protein
MEVTMTRFLRVVGILVFLAFAVGCGGGSAPAENPSPNPPPVGTNIDGNTLVTVDVKSNDVLWDPTHHKLFLAISNDSPSHPGVITSVDPMDGNLGLELTVSHEPSMLAVSDDGQFLYAGMDPTDTEEGLIQRYTLPAFTPDIQIPLGLEVPNPGEVPHKFYPIVLGTVPGSPRSAMVAKGIFRNGPFNPADFITVGVYDDEHFRPDQPFIEVNGFSWGSESGSIFLSEIASPPNIYSYDVDATGLSRFPTGTFPAEAGLDFPLLPLRLFFDKTTGHLFTSQGEVFDSATGEKIITYRVGISPQVIIDTGIFFPDPVLNQVYFVGLTDPQLGCNPGRTYYSCEATIATLDKTTGAVLRSIVFTGLIEPPAALTRWGSNGLAFTTGSVRLTEPKPGQGQVFIVSGPLVGP